ncbi:MAG: biotin/lipoyl-containing protein [Candidatus Cryptobacteroides sp.]|nr:biotin/lipoyl-binding protein [Bacteroidales bacterium]MDY2774209.1 biotin/lipoyl-containing protein [Candidatus Cryptobacteroides sp.]
MGKYNFRINGHDYQVDVNSVEGGIADVTVNGTDYKVELADAVPAPAQQAVRPAPQTVSTGAPAVTPQATAPAPQAAQTATASAPQGKGEVVTAPLPGVILDIKVKVGDAVKAGQTVAVLEAMKMENEIESTASGTVTAVNAGKGDSVLEGAAIITIG